VTPAEEAFIRSIKQNVRNSRQFRLVVEAGLTEFMGESPAQVLVMGVSEEGFRSPAQFVREVSNIFGRGAVPMYTSIIAASEDPMNLVENGDGTVMYKPRMGGLNPSEMGSVVDGSDRSYYLHDHRDPDDFAEEDLH